MNLGEQAMNRISKSAIFATVLLFGVAACGDTEEFGPGSEPDPAVASELPSQGATEEATAEEAPEEVADELEADEEEASDEEWRFVEEFSTPVVWEEAGVRLSVTGVGITDATSSEVPSEVTGLIGEDALAVVVLEVTASNDTGEVVNFYPGQGTIQVLREQVDADLLLTDSIAGSDWRDGVDSDGQVFWVLENTSFTDVVESGELTFLASAASSADYQSLTSDVEVAVTWGGQ